MKRPWTIELLYSRLEAIMNGSFKWHSYYWFQSRKPIIRSDCFLATHSTLPLTVENDCYSKTELTNVCLLYYEIMPLLGAHHYHGSWLFIKTFFTYCVEWKFPWSVFIFSFQVFHSFIKIGLCFLLLTTFALVRFSFELFCILEFFFSERFDDLMDAIPLPEYTRRDGHWNLVSR